MVHGTPAFGYKNVWPAPSARGIVSDPYQLQQRIGSRASARPRWRVARHDPHNHVGLNGHLVAPVFATPFRCWAIYRNHPQNSSVDCAWGAQPFSHGSGQVRHGDESPIRAQHRPSDPRQFIGERDDDGQAPISIGRRSTRGYSRLGGFRREVQPRRQHWFLNEKSGFPFRTPAFCSVSRGLRRLGEKEYRAPSVTPGVALRPRTQA
jgi:hypothetical protein